MKPVIRSVIDGGSGRSLEQQIAALFAHGGQGAEYDPSDPSDLSTLYQDSAGTIPVTTVGQPVGLMLDKSKGLVLGPEFVVNGDFSNGLTPWDTNRADASVVGGAAVVTTTDEYGRVEQHGSVEGGKWYFATALLTADAGGAFIEVLRGPAGSYAGIASGRTTTILYSATSRLSLIFRAPAADIIFRAASFANGATFTVYEFSVRELPGHHASQLTATARPTLQAGNKIDFDGVDDKLTTTFPDLGSNVTIVRSVPGTGASILTGQTIGAGARDDSTDHHGLLIINRALTAPETALVTKWANMRAGV